MTSPEPVTRLVLVRHGVTAHNLEGRLQGQLDVPLTRQGMEQARLTAEVVAAMDPRVVISSPLSRARATARAIASASGLAEVGVDPRLAEIDLGRWAGHTPQELRASAPDYVAAQTRTDDYRRSDGETAGEVAARIAAACEDAAAGHRGQTVVLVSHGFALRSGVAHLLGGDHRSSQVLGGLANCSWTVLDHLGPQEARRRGLERLWRLRAYNCQVPTGVGGRVASSRSTR